MKGVNFLLLLSSYEYMVKEGERQTTKNLISGWVLEFHAKDR